MESKNSGGLGIAEILTLIFIVLKLTGTIKWSWVWVLSPIWITLALIVSLIPEQAVFFVGCFGKKGEMAENDNVFVEVFCIFQFML